MTRREELIEILAQDLKFNTTNLMEKIQERPVNLHQWLSRHRRMQQEYYALKDQKEELLEDIVLELEDKQRSIIVSKQSTIKMAEKDPRYKKLLQEIRDLELDIEYVGEAKDAIKSIGWDHDRALRMLREEKL